MATFDILMVFFILTFLIHPETLKAASIKVSSVPCPYPQLDVCDLKSKEKEEDVWCPMAVDLRVKICALANLSVIVKNNNMSFPLLKKDQPLDESNVTAFCNDVTLIQNLSQLAKTHFSSRLGEARECQTQCISSVPCALTLVTLNFYINLMKRINSSAVQENSVLHTVESNALTISTKADVNPNLLENQVVARKEILVDDQLEKLQPEDSETLTSDLNRSVNTEAADNTLKLQQQNSNRNSEATKNDSGKKLPSIVTVTTSPKKPTPSQLLSIKETAVKQIQTNPKSEPQISTAAVEQSQQNIISAVPDKKESIANPTSPVVTQSRGNANPEDPATLNLNDDNFKSGLETLTDDGIPVDTESAIDDVLPDDPGIEEDDTGTGIQKIRGEDKDPIQRKPTDATIAVAERPHDMDSRHRLLSITDQGDPYLQKEELEIQRDAGFFNYFLTFTGLMLVAFVIFINKKRLIALVVEGRRPDGQGRRNRRRSVGRGESSTSYRKLENNFE